MQYEIIVRGSTDALEKVVRDYISDGWRPQGGVSFSGSQLAQAMVKGD